MSLFELIVVGNNLHKHVGIKYHHKKYKQRRATGDTIQKYLCINYFTKKQRSLLDIWHLHGEGTPLILAPGLLMPRHLPSTGTHAGAVQLPGGNKHPIIPCHGAQSSVLHHMIPAPVPLLWSHSAVLQPLTPHPMKKWESRGCAKPGPQTVF